MKTSHLPSEPVRQIRILTFAAILSVLMLSFVQQSFGQGTQTISTVGSSSFTIPAGVTSIIVECWGGGGRGSTLSSTTAGAGGGGGAYSKGQLIVTPNTSYSIFVGAGSTTTSPGQDTYFGSTSTVMAKGGNSAADNSNTPVAGQSGSVGNIVTYSGGYSAFGRTGTTNYGGGGASSGGTASNGNYPDANTRSSSGATITGGGSGGNGATTNSNGNAGFAPGGGGGSALRFSSTRTGGAGAAGQVKITWTCPTASISYASASFCKSESNPQSVNLTGSSGGTFSASPAGLSIDPATGSITPSSSNADTYTVTYNIPASSGCSEVNATASVTIDPLATPTVTVAVVPGNSVCEGSDVTFTATASNTDGGVVTYDFKVNGVSLQNTTSNTFNKSNLLNGDIVTCDISVSGGTCLSGTTATSNSINVIVNAVPTITGTTSGSVCGTGTVTLGASASDGIVNWYASSAGGSALGSGTSFITPEISTTTSFWVDATANGCTTPARTEVVATFNPLPVSIVGSDSPQCEGSTVNLFADGGVTYSWTGPNGFTGTGANVSVSNVTIASAGFIQCL